MIVFPEAERRRRQRLSVTVASIGLSDAPKTFPTAFLAPPTHLIPATDDNTSAAQDSAARSQNKINVSEKKLDTFNQTIATHDFNHAVDIGILINTGQGTVLDNRSAIEENVTDLLDRLKDRFAKPDVQSYYYFAEKLPVCTLVSTKFIDMYVRPQLHREGKHDIKLQGLQLTHGGSDTIAASGRIDLEDHFTLLPSGVLVILCTKDTYECLGLVGQPSKYIKGRFIVEIDMTEKHFVPGRKVYNRVQTMFSTVFGKTTIPFIFNIVPVSDSTYEQPKELVLECDCGPSSSKMAMPRIQNSIDLPTSSVFLRPLNQGVPHKLSDLLVAKDEALQNTEVGINAIDEKAKQEQLLKSDSVTMEKDENETESGGDDDDDDDASVYDGDGFDIIYRIRPLGKSEGLDDIIYVPLGDGERFIHRTGLLQVYEWLGLGLLNADRQLLNDPYDDPFIAQYDVDSYALLNNIDNTIVNEPTVTRSNKRGKSSNVKDKKVEVLPPATYLLTITIKGSIVPLEVQKLLRAVHDILKADDTNGTAPRKRKLDGGLPTPIYFASVIGFDDVACAWRMSDKVKVSKLEHQYLENGDNGYMIVIDTLSQLGLLYRAFSQYESAS